MPTTHSALLARAMLGLALCGALVLLSAGPSEAGPRCGGKRPTIIRGGGDNVIEVPKHGRQVIVAGGGDDVVVAMRNKDFVCAGAGDDRIFAGTGRDRVSGGSGNDYIDAGPGGDKAKGGAGDDTIIGGAGGDKLHGGSGADRVFGGIQDDNLFGDSGNDLVSGGQGTDALGGGDGDDWLRGDTNIDSYNGGAGADTLSFATATPPGPRGVDGVLVSLPHGSASGDDAGERVKGVENLVGSMFDDRLVGRGTGWAQGQLGANSCSGFRSTDCGPQRRAGPEAMIVDAGSLDPGLVVMGGSGADRWTIGGGGSTYQVTGSALRPGSGCDQAGGGDVVCSTSRPLGFILAWGGDGPDRISAQGLPETALIKLDGGPGSDDLQGGKTSDLLYAGESGADLLDGGGGDDALVSRGGGADRLFGGGGNDQLVTDSPCGGHLFRGGGGKADVAGFGHVQRRGVDARIGGGGRLRGRRHCDPTRIGGDNEVLEGSRFADVLVASGGGDLLIGRAGRDTCIGGRHKRC